MREKLSSRLGDLAVAGIMIVSGLAVTIAWIGLGAYAVWWVVDVL